MIVDRVIEKFLGLLSRQVIIDAQQGWNYADVVNLLFCCGIMEFRKLGENVQRA